MTEYILKFECCGNEISLGNDPMVGHHGDYCLKCDTKWPDTKVEKQ